MKTAPHIPIRFAAALVAVFATAALAFSAAPAAPGFKATLTGDQEVPGATTRATGQVRLTPESDGAGLAYQITVTGLNDPQAAHLHLGRVGENGPVVAALLTEPIQGPVEGHLKSGVLTAADLVGPLKGKTLADLTAAIAAGKIYVNVHTTKFPKGEIRGQLK